MKNEKEEKEKQKKKKVGTGILPMNIWFICALFAFFNSFFFLLNTFSEILKCGFSLIN